MKNIKIKIHWSFFVLGFLMIIFNKIDLFICCLLCVLLHEAGHSFVGRKLGYKLNLITLLPYGAVLSGKNAPFKPKHEILIAIAGPLVNAFLIVILIALWWVFPSSYAFTHLFVLANIYTFLFNLLPVFPLDGGRVLLAIFNLKKSRNKAFQVTKLVGYIIATLFFILFFISFFTNLNYMLGINALFLLIGLFEEDSSAYYSKLKSINNLANNINKRTIVLSEEATLFETYKILTEKNAFNILVMDSLSNEKFVLSSKEFLNTILKVPLDTKLAQLENIKHK